MSDSFPVFVDVAGARVRVGTAQRAGDSFVLRMEGLSIGGTPDAPKAFTPTSGAVFPPYGKSKGQPVDGATVSDLEYYASGCRRTLADAGKARWHDKERVLLAAIEAELAKHKGGAQEEPPLSDDNLPF